MTLVMFARRAEPKKLFVWEKTHTKVETNVTMAILEFVFPSCRTSLV
jgi:hypothetical protein